MAHLIDKDAVLAIIEQLKEEAIDMEDKARWFLSAALTRRIEALEVKEVDEEPISSFWHDASEKSLKPLGTKVLALFDDGALVELSIVDMNDIGGVVKYAYIEDLLPSDLTGIKEGGKE